MADHYWADDELWPLVATLKSDDGTWLYIYEKADTHLFEVYYEVDGKMRKSSFEGRLAQR